ncbi:MAG TPA: CHRD domain-containing protein [Nitrospirota bacterium]|nr:CHRD domain-containing protein [Nitrospirota bacterium]
MKNYGRIIHFVVNMVLLEVLLVSCGGGGGGGAYSTTPASPAPALNPATLNVTTLKADGYYFNVHTAAFPNGEIRGQIHVDPTATGSATITTPLSGAQEVPPTTSTGTGTGTLTVDLASGTATNISVTFSGLSGPATAAHIHEGAAGTTGPIVVTISLGSSPAPPAAPMPMY